LLARAGQFEASSVVLHTGTKPAFSGYLAARTLGSHAVARDGSQRLLSDLVRDANKPFYALAGVAQPQAFFGMLRELNIPLAGELGLADHDDFGGLDRSLLQNYTLLCTEKDAGKLWRLAPDALAIPLVQTIEPAFFEALDRLLAPHLRAGLSSRNG
jgi:tetraacyldisaccharide 4'-kinase